MNKRIAIVAAAALVSCGGSSWVDPTSGTFTAQDTADIMAMMSSSFSAVARQPAQAPLQRSKALTSTTMCAVSGDVTVTSAVSASCNAAGTYCTFDGNVTVTLNTCTTQNLVGLGGLEAHAWGWQAINGNTTTFDVNEHVQGGITVKRASDGSVVGTCGIFLDAHVASDGTTQTVHVTGTVCKQAVAQ